MGLLIGVVALLVVAVPALAEHHHKPEVSSVTDIVMLDNSSVSLANSGMNTLLGGGTIKTGNASATSYNYNNVRVSVVGCCEEAESDCCRSDRGRCGCGDEQEPSTQVMNMVVIKNQSMAGANTGLNLQTGNMQVTRSRCHKPVMSTGSITTGVAEAISGNENIVNFSVTGI